MGRGRTKSLIDELIRIRTKGNPALQHFVKVHLVLQGIDPAQYTADTADDAQVNQKLESMIEQFSRGTIK